MRIALHGVLALVLTALTLVGGAAWLLALRFRRRWLTFPLAYAALWALAVLAAPAFGRVALPCGGEPLRMQSPLYCLALRHFVVPEMAEVARDVAESMAQEWPGTVTLALDGGFPFPPELPLLPHLSHDDGEKLDLAFFYASPGGNYLPGRTRSPLGYFAFEFAGEDACPPAFPTLRWDLRWLQPLLSDRPLEPERTAALLRHLLADPRLGRVFVEPGLAERLGVGGDRLGFQGCRAARHDDHVHVQLGG